jgi:hypothetical protein
MYPIPLLLLIPIASASPDGASDRPFANEQPPVESPAPLPASTEAKPGRAPTFSEQLEMAKKRYFQGRHEEALTLLADLQLQVMVDAERRIDRGDAYEAMVYVGEVQYTLGNAGRAREAWRFVLEGNPDYPALSPFSHPPEVGHEFELLRRDVAAEIASRPIPVPPSAPAWTALPLGIPQFIGKRPVVGALVGGLQLGLGVTCLTMYAHLNARNVSTDPHPLGWTEFEQQRQINTQRYAIQWPAFAGFYGVWGASWLEARNTWERDHRIEAQVGWAPEPGAPASVGISGTF